MPVKLGTPPPSETVARIEIIPLIDVMFFLLAAFMLVSLDLVSLKVVPVNLPVAATAAAQTQRDSLTISVDKDGVIYIEKKTDRSKRIGHDAGCVASGASPTAGAHSRRQGCPAWRCATRVGLCARSRNRQCGV